MHICLSKSYSDWKHLYKIYLVKAVILLLGEWLRLPFGYQFYSLYNILQILLLELFWKRDFNIEFIRFLDVRKTHLFVHNSRSIAGQSNISHINEKSNIIPGANKNTKPSHGFISFITVILTFKNNMIWSISIFFTKKEERLRIQLMRNKSW